MKVIANSKKNKYCAFCKHWYDPTNSALEIVLGKDLFRIDNSTQKKCIKQNLITKALFICRYYESKM